MSGAVMTEEDSTTPQVVNLRETSVEKVNAELARVHQSGVKEIVAQEVGVHQAGVGRLTASTVSAHEIGAGSIQAEDATFENSGVVAARAGTLQLKGEGGILLANEAAVSDSMVSVLAARSVRAERVRSVVLLAGNVDGDVETSLDTRGAAIVGLIGGLVFGLFYMAAQFLFRRD